MVLSAGCGGSNTQGGTSDQSSEQEGGATQAELAQSETIPTEDTANPESTSVADGPVRVETSVVATGLEVPWDLVFTSDGAASRSPSPRAGRSVAVT